MFVDDTGVAAYSFRREYGWKGFTPRGQYMDIWEVRVQWSCDDQGGESPPATWAWQGASPTCLLVSGTPEIPSGRRYGTYTAIYEANGPWTDA